VFVFVFFTRLPLVYFGFLPCSAFKCYWMILWKLIWSTPTFRWWKRRGSKCSSCSNGDANQQFDIITLSIHCSKIRQQTERRSGHKFYAYQPPLKMYGLRKGLVLVTLYFNCFTNNNNNSLKYTITHKKVLTLNWQIWCQRKFCFFTISKTQKL